MIHRIGSISVGGYKYAEMMKDDPIGTEAREMRRPTELGKDGGMHVMTSQATNGNVGMTGVNWSNRARRGVWARGEENLEVHPLCRMKR